MNTKYIVILVIALAAIGSIMMLKMPMQEGKTGEAHKAFIGSTPQSSKPYNIQDYTK